MRILTLDAALPGCSAGLVVAGEVVAERLAHQSAELPGLVEAIFAQCGRKLDAVAVTVGPGSFTGLRSAIALAHGVGLAAGVPVLGVTVGAAMAHGVPPHRQFWAAIDSKRGKLFLEADGHVISIDLADPPTPGGPVAIGGDAAVALASRLAARGADVQLLDVRRPTPRGIADAASRGATRTAQPLYVDPPEARPGPPARPAPV